MNGYFPPNVTVIDASQTWPDLQRKGLLKGFPTNTIVSTSDMKVQYNASGYSRSSTGAQMQSRLKAILTP